MRATAVGAAAVGRVGEVGALRCLTPRLDAGTAYAVELSLNGQDYTNSTHAGALARALGGPVAPEDAPAAAGGGGGGGAFVFRPYAAPLVSVVSPVLGPYLGGTLVEVRGINLGGGTDYRCRFGRAPNVTAADGAGGSDLNGDGVVDDVPGRANDGSDLHDHDGDAADDP